MKAKQPKKDHKCPHDAQHQSGMEVCRACGDFGICRDCGAEYIRRDGYWRHDMLCYPCSALDRLRIDLFRAEMDRMIRRHDNDWKEATA